jgi:hypothetical protein
MRRAQHIRPEYPWLERPVDTYSIAIAHVIYDRSDCEPSENAAAPKFTEM